MYIFDLDLTVWECFNVHKKPIWAKQLIPPFIKKKYVITDDVGSKCILKKGFSKYIKWLNENGKIIGFCSVGSYQNLPKDLQPSILLLKKFNLYKMFNGPRVLNYKTFKKYDFLKTISEKSYFFDDNDKFLNSVSKLNNFSVIDAKNIYNWEDLIENAL